MNLLRKILIVGVVLGGSITILSAQCESWNGSPDEEQASNAHVLYRGVVKGKTADELAELPPAEFKLAYDNWKTAYELAPAADGARDWHFIDGATIYLAKYKNATDDAEKEELKATIVKLYEQATECIDQGAIRVSGDKDEYIGLLYSDLAYHMFYTLNVPYDENLEVLYKAYEKAGNAALYTAIEPAGHIAAFEFKNGSMDAQEARNLHKTVTEIAEYNIENNDTYGQYYESALARFNTAFKPIEEDVFDCGYFKNKLLPRYEENPEDLEVIKYVYSTLRKQGCDTTDADVQRLKLAYEEKAAQINAEIEAERRANNPGYDAAQLQKEGKYEQAVARYKEAIAQEDDPEKLAQFYYSVAFIQTWQLNQYQSARSNARKAAEYKDGWGKPFILIGDVYAKSAASCGSDGFTRGLAVLAAIDKYAYARNIDDATSDEANRKISAISGSKPPVEDIFQRGTGGQTVTVPCWIGERVRVPNP